MRKDNWISINELELINLEEVDLVTLSKDVKILAFREEEIIARDIGKQSVKYKNIATGLLNAHPFFGKIRKHTLTGLVNDFNFEPIKEGTVFCQENQHLNNLIVLITGILAAEDPTRSVTACTVLYGGGLSETNIPASIRAKDKLSAKGSVVVGQASLYRVGHLLKSDMKEMLEDRVNFDDKKQSNLKKSDFKIDELMKPEEALKVLFLSSDYFGEEYIAKVGASKQLVFVRLVNKQEIKNAKFEKQLVVGSSHQHEKKMWRELITYPFANTDFAPLKRCYVGKTQVMMSYRYVWGSNLRRVIKKLGKKALHRLPHIE